MNYLCGHAMLADGRLLVAGVTEKFEQTEGFPGNPHFPGLYGRSPGDRHILESDDFLPHPLAIGPSELDQFLEPAGRFGKGRLPSGTRGRSHSHSAVGL
jgi:hypothetical protein